MPSLSNCRSCDAKLVWATTASGKKMPLEQCSLAEGNIRIDATGIARVGKVGTGPYRSHFATCPNSKDWRKDKPDGGEAA
jgi:hypothetical protein